MDQAKRQAVAMLRDDLLHLARRTLLTPLQLAYHLPDEAVRAGILVDEARSPGTAPR